MAAKLDKGFQIIKGKPGERAKVKPPKPVYRDASQAKRARAQAKRLANEWLAKSKTKGAE